MRTSTYSFNSIWGDEARSPALISTFSFKDVPSASPIEFRGDSYCNLLTANQQRRKSQECDRIYPNSFVLEARLILRCPYQESE